MSDRPNIIFILTDQQSATMMSAAGNPYLNTPALDRLAANGTRFEKAYCANPVCVPSRVSLMTGRMPAELGVRDNYNLATVPDVPPRVAQTTLAPVLKNAGYDVAYGGKVHLPKSLQPDVLGFEVISTDERDQLAVDCADYVKRGHQERPFFLYASFVNPHDICYMAIRSFARTEHDHALLRNGRLEVETLDRALRRPDGVSDEEFFDRFCPPVPPNFDPQEDEPEAIKRIREQRAFKMAAHEDWSENDWRLHRYAYCRLTEMVDAQIGTLLDAVKDAGLEEDTVVIFSSDHGDLDGSRRMEHKTALYDEATCVPLLVSWPGTTPGGRVDDSHLISNGLDLLPTLCDYAGVEKPEELAGRSFRPLTEGEGTVDAWRDHLVIESEFGKAVRTADHKYALYDEGASREQLYDFTNDPHETVNAANEPDNATVLEWHRELIANFGKTF